MVYLLHCLSSQEYWQEMWRRVSSLAGVYGLHPVAVDFSGEHNLSGRPPYWFPSLEVAMAHPDLAECTWVWLTQNGDTYLDEYAHPGDNVVYCVGDNIEGFRGGPGSGPHLKLRPMTDLIPENAEHPPELVAYNVLFDRFMYMSGRRA